MNSKESEVLRLLADGKEMTGLQLVKRSDGTLKRGSVYVTLLQLEERGLVESHEEITERRYYRLARLDGPSD